MTLLKDNNFKDINIALLSLENDIKNKAINFDTSTINKQLDDINKRIDEINAGSNSSAEINDIRINIEDINNDISNISADIDNIELELSNVFLAENLVEDFNTTIEPGVYFWADSSQNRPAGYGILLVLGTDWVNQTAYGTDGRIYFRQKINTSEWTTWQTLAYMSDTVNLTSSNIKASNNLTIENSTDLTLSTFGEEALSIGTETGLNLGIDTNEIQARSNGSTSPLYLNDNGGMVVINDIGSSDGGLRVEEKLIIPIGRPDVLEDGCIWIER